MHSDPCVVVSIFSKLPQGKEVCFREFLWGLVGLRCNRIHLQFILHFFQIMIRQDHFENILYFSKVKLTPLHMILK